MGSGGMKRKGRRRLAKVKAPMTHDASPESATADAANWFLRTPEDPPLPGDVAVAWREANTVRYFRWAGFAAIVGIATRLRRGSKST